MSNIDKILNNGYGEDMPIVVFSNPSYEGALVGVSDDGKSIYDFNLMVEWFCEHEELTEIEAIEFIEYNTIRSLPYQDNAPIIMYRLEDI